jgi:hypothetical protein
MGGLLKEGQSHALKLTDQPHKFHCSVLHTATAFRHPAPPPIHPSLSNGHFSYTCAGGRINGHSFDLLVSASEMAAVEARYAVGGLIMDASGPNGVREINSPPILVWLANVRILNLMLCSSFRIANRQVLIFFDHFLM